jgi:SpoVK/Ycf46/Vps4 family AAA+-type ATPase
MSITQIIRSSLPSLIAQHESTRVFYDSLMQGDSSQEHTAKSAALALNYLQEQRQGPYVQVEGIRYGDSQEKFLVSVYAAHKKMLAPYATLVEQGVFLRSLSCLSPSLSGAYAEIQQNNLSSTNIRSPPPIIGYEQERKKVFSLVHRLGFYQPVTQENQELPTQKIPLLILEGAPGCGKSLFLEHVKYRCRMIARYKDIPCATISVTNADKSSYQAESAKNIRGILTRAQNPQGISVITVDEADVVFPSRSKTEADQHFTSEFIKMVSGEGVNYVGNTAIIMATNYLNNIDSRIIDRCGQANVISLKTPTNPSFLENLLLSKLSLYEHELSDEDVQHVAQRISGKQISIREITNILDAANENCKQYHTISPEFFTNNPSCHNAKPLGLEHILRVLNTYGKT